MAEKKIKGKFKKLLRRVSLQRKKYGKFIKARKNINLIKRLGKELGFKFITLGLALHNNRVHGYWKELGYVNFRSFMCDNISSQSRGYRSIEIVEIFYLEYNINVERLGRIGEKKLGMLIPVIQNKSITEVKKWLNLAEHFSAILLKAKIKSERKEQTEEIKKLLLERKIDLPQDRLMAIEQIVKLTNYSIKECEKLLTMRNKYGELQQTILSGDDAEQMLKDIKKRKDTYKCIPSYQHTRGMFIECDKERCHYAAFDTRNGDLLMKTFLLNINGITKLSRFFHKKRRAKHER